MYSICLLYLFDKNNILIDFCHYFLIGVRGTFKNFDQYWSTDYNSPLLASKKDGYGTYVPIHTETSFYGPSEYLLQKDDLLDSVFYVCRGSLEVLDNDIVVAILGTNSPMAST